MTGDEIENARPDAVADDALTDELAVLTEADIAAIEATDRLQARIADEFDEAAKKNAELTALSSQREEELAALRSALAAKERARQEFSPGETRKLVRRDAHGSLEFAVRPGQMNLGSAPDNDIRIEDAFISRHHAQIVSGPRETVVRDLNSLNGTYVNSRRISRCALHDGDSITVGKLSFTFVRHGSAATVRGRWK